MDFHAQLNCRMCCSRNLELFFTLGAQPLANQLLCESHPANEPMFPLGLLFCMDCNLVQLSHVVNPEFLFVHDYVYLSSGMPSSPHFIKYAEEIKSRFLKDKDFVIEVGSNDGHFLYLIQKYGAKVLGVDPAENASLIAQGRGIPTRTEFFGKKTAEAICNTYGKAQVIIGNNVVAHIDDHYDLFGGITALLAEDGVFVFEAPYLADFFDLLAFDSIYHEHMSYLALRPLVTLCQKFGLEIFDVKHFPVQGNSLRYYAARADRHKVMPSVAEYLAKEEALGFGRLATYMELVKKIECLKADVCQTLAELKHNGKNIAAYGSPARGNTLLNYFGIGRDMLEFATEALPSKIGKFTPGMHIPIVDIKWARENPPDYYLLLAWPYKNVVLENEKDFLAGGGKFIIPVGEERIIPLNF